MLHPFLKIIQSTDSESGLACAIRRKISIWQFMATTHQTSEKNIARYFISGLTCFKNVGPRLVMFFHQRRTFGNETAPVDEPFLTGANANRGTSEQMCEDQQIRIYRVFKWGGGK